MLSALRCAAPALLLATVVLVPFLDKAFTIDDTMFLRQAEQLLNDPVHPTAFEMVWSESTEPRRMSAIMPSGPGMAYLLVPSVASGGHEWIAHLEQLLLLALAIAATAALALRLGGSPDAARAAALLLAATPAALAMAGTAMPDIPAMAFGALGLERVLAWRDDQHGHQCLVATAALALAALARPHLLLLLAIAALALPRDFLARASWRKTRLMAFLPIALAPAAVVGLTLLTRDPEGAPSAWLGAAQTFSSLKNLASNVAAFGVHWTLVLPFSLPWAALRWRALVRQPLLCVAALGLALVLFPASDGRFLWLVPVIALTASALWDVFADGFRRRDAVQLVLGLWLLLPLAVTPYPHMPSKYLLASAPAAAILIGRSVALRSRAFSRVLVGATVAAGVALGVAILHADASFAELGRRAAAEWITPHVAAGRRVWFAGHWGFQWYAERAGARPLTSTPPYPERGDLAVSSLRSLGAGIGRFPQRRLLARIEDARPGGRIMSFALGAGFYSNYWGLLPWAWGDEVLERLELWELE
jgi:4-amino-4-deoxy-L-arabinose transferase-like glycosyltransferase